MRKRKIIYAASTFSHLERFHSDYIAALRNDGYEVITLASGAGADIDLHLEKKIFSPANIKTLLRLARILRRVKPDAVILNTTLAAVAVRIALPILSRPRVVNISHGYLFSENSREIRNVFLRMCEGLLARRTDALIVMNSEDLRLAVRYKLYSENVYFIKGMGVKLPLSEFSRDDVRRELMLGDRFVITFVGELSKRKNQEMLIRALPKLLLQIPCVHLLLVGDGAERGYLEGLARELGVSYAVSLLGHRSDVPRLLSATDLYASPSLSEGLPFNVVEACSLGLTVLISDVKGHSDIVDNGTDGFLFQKNNIADFVNKTYQIYSKSIKIDPDKAIEKATQFSYDKVYLKTLSIIRKEIRYANLHLGHTQG